MNLYKKIGKSEMRGKDDMTQDSIVEKIANMAQVVAILHNVRKNSIINFYLNNKSLIFRSFY